MGMGYWPDNTFTVIYKQNGKVVAAPTDMGTYQVYVTVPGNEDINAVSELTDPSWTFTITHTGNHQWGDSGYPPRQCPAHGGRPRYLHAGWLRRLLVLPGLRQLFR